MTKDFTKNIYVCATPTVELKLSHIKFTGIALITDWYCQQGTIPMDSFTMPVDDYKFMTDEEFETFIRKNANDGGFGAKDINAVQGSIIAVYKSDFADSGYEMLLGNFFLKLDETAKDVEVGSLTYGY